MIEFVNSFLRYTKYEKRYSDNTISSCRIDLGHFCLFISDKKINIDDLTGQDIRQWVYVLVEEGMAASSVNRKISTLKSFFKYLQREGVITETPMSSIVSLKGEKKLPQFLSIKETDYLFSNIDFGNSFEGIRDNLVLDILYSTGIRRAELLNITLGDIDLEKSVLLVTGKRDKQRIIPLLNELTVTINKYLESQEETFGKVNDHLILTNKGLKAYPGLVYRIVNKYLSKVSLLEKKSPHVLRHTFATQMLNRGADINSVKELLGHASLAATQVYTHNTFERLKDVYNQAHPRAN